jgi:ferredoxin
MKGAALLRGRGLPLTERADREAAAAFARSARDLVVTNLETHRLRRRARLDRETEARLGLMAADGGELVDPSQAFEGSELGLLPGWLAENHDHPLWRTLAPRCRGCGNCAAVCSTSPCFDVDEREAFARRRAGQARNGGGASGGSQMKTEQFRQRVMHKFSIHPRRFHEVLCTGCGRCSRTCAGGMSLPEILGQLVQLAGPPQERAAT